MINYGKVEFFKLAKTMTAIYAFVLSSEAFFNKTKDAHIDILHLAWRRSPVTGTHCSYMLEKIRICKLMSCALFYRTRDARFDMLNLTGHLQDRHMPAQAHTSRLTPHNSHLAPHASHLTPHTSHLAPHSSHLTPHLQGCPRRDQGGPRAEGDPGGRDGHGGIDTRAQ